MRAELGLERGALEAVVRAAYGLLGLITFFTAVGGERGARPEPAAGAAPPTTRPAGSTPTCSEGSSAPR